jgi:hypothetical protein
MQDEEYLDQLSNVVEGKLYCFTLFTLCLGSCVSTGVEYSNPTRGMNPPLHASLYAFLAMVASSIPGVLPIVETCTIEKLDPRSKKKEEEEEEEDLCYFVFS